jgi:GxxExxY protein
MFHLTDENEIAIFDIIGAAMDVHSELKSGLLEAVYAEAMTIELDNRGVEYDAEVNLPIFYKGKLMKKQYRMDIVCRDVVVELKAVEEILPEHRLQLFNYLRLTKKTFGILINFGESSLHFEKYYYEQETNEIMFYKKYKEQHSQDI